jgi:alkylation response protein AidB-like acyl-CoA dehydrogenase
MQVLPISGDCRTALKPCMNLPTKKLKKNSSSFNKGATAAMDLTEPDAGSDLQAVQLKATYDEQKNNGSSMV